jgi:FMN reductase [NAD(P)H]
MLSISKIIQKHKTVANFLDKPIENVILDEILISAQGMPSFHEGQNVSVIVVKDPIRKNTIANILGGREDIKTAPVLVVFVVDFYKTSIACDKCNVEQLIKDSLGTFGIVSVDIGLALGAAVLAAQSKGVSTRPINNIKDNMKEISKELDLPKYTLPIIGVALGYAAEGGVKYPKLPLPTFIHEETYKDEAISTYVHEYDEMMATYFKEQGLKNVDSWSESISAVYENKDSVNLKEYLLKQGFNFASE